MNEWGRNDAQTQQLVLRLRSIMDAVHQIKPNEIHRSGAGENSVGGPSGVALMNISARKKAAREPKMLSCARRWRSLAD